MNLGIGNSIAVANRTLRSRGRKYFPIVILFMFFVLISSPVSACSCSPEVSAPACQLISRTTVVFVGESVELVPDPTAGSFGRPIYRFRVARVYKGLNPATQEVLVNPDHFTSCTTEYPTGKTYLMFARLLSENPEILIAGGCSGSRRADLHRSDIAFLESYVQGRTETTVYGKVLQWVDSIGRPDDEESAPLAGANVTLMNAFNRFESVTEPDGRFRFEGIPEGDYQVSAELDPYMADPFSYRITVSKGCCKEVFLQLKARSGIQGVLLTPDGQPAAKERVELLRKNRREEWYSTYKMWAQTDEQGTFRFDDLESGEYLLGHEIWGDSASHYTPYPTHYYPGVPTRSAAQPISLAPQEIIKGLVLTLPRQQTPRKITIKVVWPDGRPIGENLLQISDQAGLVKNLEGEAHRGTVIFIGYEEREYDFRARYWIDNLRGGSPVFAKRLAKSDLVKLAPGKGAVEVILVLRHELVTGDDR